MTPKQKTLKAYLIKSIQINKHNVFDDDEQRYEFIKSRFGKDSLKDLSIDQLQKMEKFCLRKVSDIPILNEVSFKEFVTTAQLSKIRTMWDIKSVSKAEEALLNFCFKITGYKVQRLENLLKGKATKVIVALEKMV